MYVQHIYIDDDVSGSCGGKYDTSMPTMNSSSSNIIHQASSSHPLFGFENCGSSSAIEELNFSVLHNVSSQNNLSNETRKLLKKRWDLKKNYDTNGSKILSIKNHKDYIFYNAIVSFLT